jgi:predicted ribosome quality control (RQC) complex YloA/Tae2 family protein
LIEALSGEIACRLCRGRLRKAESGDGWLALSFPGDRIIFFSWDAELYGLCEATADEIRSLSQLASSRPPIQSAAKAHLAGAEITGSRALGRDRVLEIVFRREVGAGFFQIKKLIFEASGRYSNLVLLDEDGTVIEAAKHIHPETNRYRSIIPGQPYTPPPPIDGVSPEDFAGELDGLDNISGLGKPLIEAIKKKCGALGECDAGRIVRQGLQAPPIYQKLGRYVTLFGELLAGANLIGTDSALAAARECVMLPLLERHAEKARKRAAAKIERLARVNSRKIAEARAAQDSGTAAESLKRDGQLILANIWRIPPRARFADLPEWGESGETVRRVELDPNRDAPGNAERYFAKYRKKRASAERAKKILPELYLEKDAISEQEALLACHTDALTILSMMDELSSGEAPMKGKKRHERLKPPHRRFEFSGENAVILVGLSAAGNHYVTFRLASGDDIWFHAQGIPGAHVILRFTSKPDPETYERMIAIAASSAAFHSKAKESGRARVDYAERRHVRAIPGAGPAQVTYREFSSINADAALWKAYYPKLMSI